MTNYEYNKKYAKEWNKNNTKNSYLIIENNKIVLKDVEGNIISKKDI